jgi:hypothetical protein
MLSWVFNLISKAVFSAPSNDWGKPPTKRRVKTRHASMGNKSHFTQLNGYLFPLLYTF